MLYNYYNTDTTDVQKVQAVQMGTSILLQCEFITGTDAQGCSVVLVGTSEINNTTHAIITQNKTDSSTNITEFERLINSTNPLSCYQSVYGFDIESDGSVGALAVPGELLINTSMTTTCNTQSTVTPPPSGIVYYFIVTGMWSNLLCRY